MQSALLTIGKGLDGSWCCGAALRQRLDAFGGSLRLDGRRQGSQLDGAFLVATTAIYFGTRLDGVDAVVEAEGVEEDEDVDDGEAERDSVEIREFDAVVKVAGQLRESKLRIRGGLLLPRGHETCRGERANESAEAV